MKYLYTIFSLSIVILMSSCTSSRYYQSDQGEYYQSQPQVTYQQFYNELSPYGNWINYGNYGYAWVPSMSNFRPYYTNGHWVYTNYGWTWVSNYNWGWAPFHYGRWMNDMRYGWVWIPGNEWAPAWVSWRGGGDYYGWAPLGPGMGINEQFGSIPYTDWTFVQRNYITNRNLHNYYINRSRNVTIINNTTIINNNTVVNNGTRRANYNAGPPVRDVERNTGISIRKYNLETSNKPGQTRVSNNAVRVFRPEINQQSSNSSNIRPERVTNGDQGRSSGTAPVREIPKNQTPQILRDEPPVNRPSITPREDNTPARVFPAPQPTNRSVEPNTPARENPPARNRQQETPINQAPVRTFPNNPTPPNNQTPAARERSNNLPADNQSPTNRPVRSISNQQQAASNPYKQDESKINSRPSRSSEGARRNNERASRIQSRPAQPTAPAVRQPTRTLSSPTPNTSTISEDSERKNVNRE
ncbi:MAG: DUF6600 domain-containing protein [Ginsengibacter sp.]